MIKRVIDEMLAAAVAVRASDIYVLPQATGYLVRLRYAQTVRLWREVSRAMGEQLISYLKFQANMAISDQRRPQVGALNWAGKDGDLELRFSTVGDYAARESLVIRIIYPYFSGTMAFLDARQPVKLTQLAQQRGLMVFAGPTGSGKTTTMYLTARQLERTAMVLTIEDPIEIREPNFVQLQVNVAAGMTYAELLKVGLRHRPDVFIIGEIRDRVTAQAAVRAALSGHLVLSTVHARSAGGVLTRLTELGVSLNQLQQVLTMTSYQRLVPRVTGGPAVLLDIVTGREFQNDQQLKFSERWWEALEMARINGEVSQEVAQQLRCG